MSGFRMVLAAGAAGLALMSSAAGQPSVSASADALSAAGDFGSAALAYESALKASPKDAGALAGLARVRLYENRVGEAIALAQQALALAPDSPVARATLTVAQQRKAAFAEDRYQVTGLAAEAVIPFAATDPLPIVQVSVGGRQAEFLIDTGAPDVLVSVDLVSQLGLHPQAAGEGVFAGGKRAPVERTVVPELQIGSVRIANAPAGVMRGGLASPGHKIDGVIGTGLLMHFAPTLDYCAGRLVLRPRGGSAEVERAARRSGANVVPIWLAGDHFVLARARLKGGSERLFLVDTGLAGGGLTASKEVLDEAGVAIDPSAARTGMGGGGPVTFIPFRAGATLGSMTVEDVPGSYMPGGDATGIFPFKTAGVISHMFFRHSRLTFDFEAMRLITQAC